MKVLIWPDPKLKITSLPLDLAPPKDIVKGMFEAMNTLGGVGLSAIQVGIPIRVVVSTIDRVSKTFVNPSWQPSGFEPGKMMEMVPMREGCLSVPNQFETVRRWPRIQASWLDQDMVAHTEILDGLWAQMLQHECEHLDGRMFVDHLKSADRSRIKGAMMKLKRSRR